MKKLTVVIPFSNEGAYLRKTLGGIRLTADEEVDIVLIDDASNDGIKYDEIAEEYNCKYVKNEERIGPTASKGKGVEVAETPYILFIDAHMSFYFNDWHTKLVEALEDNSRAVYCANPVPLNRYARRDPNVLNSVLRDPNVVGLRSNRSRTSFVHASNGDTNLIPILFGGSYAMSKDYFNSLDGSGSLKGVGFFNLLLSMKVFLEGGDVVFLEDVEIGHVYTDLLAYERNKEGFEDDSLLLTGLFLDLAGVETEDPIIETGSKERIDEREKGMDYLKEFICDNLNERTVESFMEFRESFQEELIIGGLA